LLSKLLVDYFFLNNFQGEELGGSVEVVYGPSSFAAQLIAKGASPDAVEPETGIPKNVYKDRKSAV
jgi:hypothetical protein